MTSEALFNMVDIQELIVEVQNADQHVTNEPGLLFNCEESVYLMSSAKRPDATNSFVYATIPTDDGTTPITLCEGSENEQTLVMGPEYFSLFIPLDVFLAISMITTAAQISLCRFADDMVELSAEDGAITMRVIVDVIDG